jgi:hypothetical protein
LPFKSLAMCLGDIYFCYVSLHFVSLSHLTPDVALPKEVVVVMWILLAEAPW